MFQAHGTTSDGRTWRWLGEPLESSVLCLLAPSEPMTAPYRWRFNESVRLRNLFAVLRLPEVQVKWEVADRALTSDLQVPMWHVNGERHACLYGVTGKLWSSLEFDPGPPKALVREWVEWHADLELALPIKQCRS